MFISTEKSNRIWQTNAESMLKIKKYIFYLYVRVALPVYREMYRMCYRLKRKPFGPGTNECLLSAHYHKSLLRISTHAKFFPHDSCIQVSLYCIFFHLFLHFLHFNLLSLWKGLSLPSRAQPIIINRLISNFTQCVQSKAHSICKVEMGC